MLHKTSDLVYSSTLLEGIPRLAHGFSTRRLGNMRKNVDNQMKFMSLLGIPKLPITGQQVHGINVATITKRDSVLDSDVDGLVTNLTDSLGVVTADCVPILLVDAINQIVGIVHAGWKGTLRKITTHTIAKMKVLGAKSENILVVIGPHIGMCCYKVSEDRAALFEKEFDRDPRVSYSTQGTSYVDIGFVNMLTLMASGIKKDHIDAPVMCTSCQHNDFFSYRKDTKATYGNMMAVIGYEH